MNSSIIGFIIKVFALSALIGVGIKYGVPLLHPAPSLGLCLVLLLAPVGMMTVLFLRQAE
jgi:hypothetical protein